jgi:hypothetical protein
MQVGYRVYKQWIDHPLNYFEELPYSGKIVSIKENNIVVKTKTLGVIEVIKKEGDKIFRK